MPPPTPSQTVGPFFEIAFGWLDATELVPPSSQGAIRIEGTVYDGAGEPVPDAVLEVFQADARGRFRPDTEPAWTGFGRCLSDEGGRFQFVTVKPGPVAPGVAPHLDLSVFARGLLQRLVTRCYFSDEDRANRDDPVLQRLGERATTLVASLEREVYRFDLHLQGARETVFFAW